MFPKLCREGKNSDHALFSLTGEVNTSGRGFGYHFRNTKRINEVEPKGEISNSVFFAQFKGVRTWRPLRWMSLSIVHRRMA